MIECKNTVIYKEYNTGIRQNSHPLIKDTGV